MIMKRKLTTLTTDENGQASYVYNSTGCGDVTFAAKFHDDDSSELTETYSIEDVRLYNTGSKITSDWDTRTDISGRVIYYREPSFQSDTEATLEFKLNNLPSYFLIGFSNAKNNLYSKGAFFRDNGTLKIWYDGYTQATLSNTITTDTVFKIIVTNTNTIKWYIDDVLVATRTNTGNGKDLPLNLRVDDFASTLQIGYIKVL